MKVRFLMAFHHENVRKDHPLSLTAALSVNKCMFEKDSQICN